MVVVVVATFALDVAHFTSLRDDSDDKRFISWSSLLIVVLVVVVGGSSCSGARFQQLHPPGAS